MPTFTIINEAGGPVRAVHVLDEAQAQAQLQPGESLVAGPCPPHSYYDGTNWIPRPEQPTPFCRWTASGWKDIRDPEAVAQQAAEAVRKRRGELLMASDWTQGKDATARITKAQQAAWAQYRQALCDITKQPGFPFKITWPTPPT